MPNVHQFLWFLHFWNHCYNMMQRSTATHIKSFKSRSKNEPSQIIYGGTTPNAQSTNVQDIYWLVRNCRCSQSSITSASKHTILKRIETWILLGVSSILMSVSFLMQFCNFWELNIFSTLEDWIGWYICHSSIQCIPAPLTRLPHWKFHCLTF